MLHFPVAMVQRVRGIDEGGHTLIELVTVVVIVSVAAALSFPSLAAMRRGQELEAAAVGAAQCLRLARWRAVTAGRRVRVVPRFGGDGRWRLETQREEEGRWVREGEERPLPRGASLTAAGPEEKVFFPDGTCSLGSFTLRSGGDEVYRLTLTPATGRVRFYRGDREAGRGH